MKGLTKIWKGFVNLILLFSEDLYRKIKVIFPDVLQFILKYILVFIRIEKI